MIEESCHLVACPFCRGRPALVAEPAIHVACSCGVKLWGGNYFHFDNFAQAIAAWNRNAWTGVDTIQVSGSECIALCRDEVLVAIARGEGYEDVVPELVACDAFETRGKQFAWRVVTRENDLSELESQADPAIAAPELHVRSLYPSIASLPTRRARSTAHTPGETAVPMFHLHLVVRDALLNMSDDELEGMFRDAHTHRVLTVAECRAYLGQQLAQRRVVIPLDPSCDNFDHSGRGCRGHATDIDVCSRRPFDMRTQSHLSE